MSNRDSNVVEIKNIIDEWASAVRNKDIGGATARHSDDIIMFDVPPPNKLQGIDAYKETWNLFFDNTPGGEGSFDISELEISAGKDVAFCSALIDVNGTTARLTVGLQKIDNQWLIMHEHHSYTVKPS